MNFNLTSKFKLDSGSFFKLYWIGLAVLLIIKIIIVIPRGDFLGYYAFFSSDSYDWIANGTRLFDNENISFRNPGLPLIIKVLHKLSALNFIILLNQIVYLGIMLYTYKISAQITKSKLLSLLAPSILFLNYGLQLFSNYILSDLYAIFFVSGATYFILKDNFRISFLFLGVSMLFQNFSYFLVPVFVLYFVLKIGFENLFIKNKLYMLQCFFILSFLPVSWHVYKFLIFGNFFYTKIVQFDLVYFHTNLILSYLLNLFMLYGFLPLISIVMLYFVSHKIKFNSKLIFLTMNLLVTLIFWIFFYDWNERRFMYYTIPFALPIMLYAITLLNYKVQIKLLFLLPLMIYPTFLYSEGAFVNNKIPIAHNKLLAFSLKESKYEDTSMISSPMSIESSDTPFISLINPAFSESLRESKKAYKGNHFKKYMNYVNSNFSDTDLTICLDTTLRGYWANAALLIMHNYSLSQLKVSTTNCDLSSFNSN